MQSNPATHIVQCHPITVHPNPIKVLCNVVLSPFRCVFMGQSDTVTA